jgi:hypothetical protein
MSDLVYAVKLSLFVFKKKKFVFELCTKSRRSVHLERKKAKRLCQHVLMKLLPSLPPEEPFKSPEWQTFLNLFMQYCHLRIASSSFINKLLSRQGK